MDEEVCDLVLRDGGDGQVVGSMSAGGNHGTTNDNMRSWAQDTAELGRGKYCELSSEFLEHPAEYDICITPMDATTSNRRQAQTLWRDVSVQQHDLG